MQRPSNHINCDEARKTDFCFVGQLKSPSQDIRPLGTRQYKDRSRPRSVKAKMLWLLCYLAAGASGMWSARELYSIVLFCHERFCTPDFHPDTFWSIRMMCWKQNAAHVEDTSISTNIKNIQEPLRGKAQTTGRDYPVLKQLDYNSYVEIP